MFDEYKGKNTILHHIINYIGCSFLISIFVCGYFNLFESKLFGGLFYLFLFLCFFLILGFSKELTEWIGGETNYNEIISSYAPVRKSSEPSKSYTPVRQEKLPEKRIVYSKSLRDIFKEKPIKSIICSGCLKSIVFKDTSVICPFCDNSFSYDDDNDDLENAIFDECPTCSGKIKFYSCPHCACEIDLFEPYNYEELERRRYE